MPFAGIFFSVSIYLPDGFVVFMVWACVDVLKSFFSFFLFVSFSQSICGWIEETGEIKRRKKILFFLPVSVRERGGGEWIEANANPLLVCHYIVTFLYLQQSSGSFSRLIYWFFLHLFFWDGAYSLE